MTASHTSAKGPVRNCNVTLYERWALCNDQPGTSSLTKFHIALFKDRNGTKKDQAVSFAGLSPVCYKTADSRVAVRKYIQEVDQIYKEMQRLRFSLAVGKHHPSTRYIRNAAELNEQDFTASKGLLKLINIILLGE
ncbi:hypothetical protein KIN20_008860 [Parelaphostrongylus tenuis]|uniref:Uncharacterized protein n=1 Tax=Parelaphostrongylus tenuis TaxID=148309 RepID=A0AAD5MX48_PARTN|nr:hypothetical protein KIN20_008860 [Parelaphostrongylus tenuis]